MQSDSKVKKRQASLPCCSACLRFQLGSYGKFWIDLDRVAAGANHRQAVAYTKLCVYRQITDFGEDLVVYKAIISLLLFSTRYCLLSFLLLKIWSMLAPWALPLVSKEVLVYYTMGPLSLNLLFHMNTQTCPIINCCRCRSSLSSLFRLYTTNCAAPSVI